MVDGVGFTQIASGVALMDELEAEAKSDAVIMALEIAGHAMAHALYTLSAMRDDDTFQPFCFYQSAEEINSATFALHREDGLDGAKANVRDTIATNSECWAFARLTKMEFPAAVSATDAVVVDASAQGLAVGVTMVQPVTLKPLDASDRPYFVSAGKFLKRQDTEPLLTHVANGAKNHSHIGERKAWRWIEPGTAPED